MPVMLAVYPLLTAAEYVVSACAGLLIGIGITDNPEPEILDDTAHASVAAGGRDIGNDVKLGEAKANERIARITKSGVLARSTEKCELCPANVGTPTREKRSFGNDINLQYQIHTLWISRWIATARERIPGSIDNYVTGVSECSQQRGNLKDNGYILPGLNMDQDG
ncbi:hypothetical protein [Photorhabdus heterorhabditis]|uniref:hypothetical protein n=1 Tax=Photorhabdus heterorhabditis TaxID=880156 RepID=UPI0015623B48|nr:hypothetical protein [Photorhabdus heterorhabditis]NRN29866.1 hypothetical protein [Photorhabdus heterorhabditis subsp. aluminescens]